jgi:F0F1-type ATP synthase assembly protein I
LTAAIASLPGALVGDVIGRNFGSATRGSIIGVIVFSLIGWGVGFFVGRSIVVKNEAAKRAG